MSWDLDLASHSKKNQPPGHGTSRTGIALGMPNGLGLAGFHEAKLADFCAAKRRKTRRLTRRLPEALLRQSSGACSYGNERISISMCGNAGCLKVEDPQNGLLPLCLGFPILINRQRGTPKKTHVATCVLVCVCVVSVAVSVAVSVSVSALCTKMMIMHNMKGHAFVCVYIQKYTCAQEEGKKVERSTSQVGTLL